MDPRMDTAFPTNMGKGMTKMDKTASDILASRLSGLTSKLNKNDMKRLIRESIDIADALYLEIRQSRRTIPQLPKTMPPLPFTRGASNGH